jgi:Tfp pilus assembly protein PilV
LLEITIALLVMSVTLMASAGAFTTSLRSVGRSQVQSRGGVFLQTVMEDVAAQPYANLLTLNGTRVYDHANAASSTFSVDLTVFLASVDLQQVQAVLTDLRSQKVIARVTTMRTRT